jgi:PAS domain S-box-containing protein
MENGRREAEQQVVEILENLSEGFMTVDHQWDFLYLNRQAERFLRRSRQELLGKNIWDMFPEARGSTFEKHYRQVALDGKPVEFEEFYPPLETWFSVRTYPIAQGLAIYFLDITGKRAERERLAESERRFRLLARATNDALWDWNPLAGELWWSDGFESMLGFAPGELQLDITNWQERIHPDDRERILSEVSRVIKEGRPDWTGEYRYQRRDGTYAQVVGKGHVVVNERGQVIRMIGGIADVSERWRAQQELTRQAALLDRASDAILVRSLENRLLYLNRKAIELYGWTLEEAMGKSAHELLAQDAETLASNTQAVLEAGEWSGEMEVFTRAGRKLVMFSRWTLLRDANGEPESIMTINTDITEKVRLEGQLRHTQRMESIGTLASGIAHDLNNVLSPILMSVELLREQLEPGRSAGLLENLLQCAQRGASLVRQILALANPCDGERVVFDASKILDEVAQILQETLPKNIESSFVREPCPLRPLIKGDPTQVHQVLMNLCVNARDAMPSGGRLSVKLSTRDIDSNLAAEYPDLQPGPYLVVQVEDSGHGIPKEIQAKIFEPFFTTKNPGHGTGLGLPTCFRIVKSHAGAIAVDSTPGRGTRVEVYLPLTEEEWSSVEDPPIEDKVPGGSQLLLLVDDEESIRQVVALALERSGYRVLTAANGAEGLTVYTENQGKIAAVIADMSMPIMDGPTMIAALRSLDPEVTVIGSSGLSSRAQVLETGAREFLPKPYTVRQLLLTIENLLPPEGEDGAATPRAAATSPGEVTPGSSALPPTTAGRASADQEPAISSDRTDILLVEDESMLVALAIRILRSEGHTIHAATTGPEGVELFQRMVDQISMVICDLELPGLDGQGVFKEVRRLAPEVPFILTTGHIQLPDGLAEAARNGQLELLCKPYSAAQLREKVRAILSPEGSPG